MALTHEFEMFKSSEDVVFNKETRKNMVNIEDTFIIWHRYFKMDSVIFKEF